MDLPLPAVPQAMHEDPDLIRLFCTALTVVGPALWAAQIGMFGRPVLLAVLELARELWPQAGDRR